MYENAAIISLKKHLLLRTKSFVHETDPDMTIFLIIYLYPQLLGAQLLVSVCRHSEEVAQDLSQDPDLPEDLIQFIEPGQSQTRSPVVAFLIIKCFSNNLNSTLLSLDYCTSCLYLTKEMTYNAATPSSMNDLQSSSSLRMM